VIRSKIVGVETMIGNEGIAWRSGVAQVKARSSYSGAKKSTIDLGWVCGRECQEESEE